MVFSLLWDHLGFFWAGEIYQVKKKKKKKKNKTNHKSYRLLSATNEWTTTVKAVRSQNKNNCANDKQMESQTNPPTRLPSGKTKAAD